MYLTVSSAAGDVPGVFVGPGASAVTSSPAIGEHVVRIAVDRSEVHPDA